MSPQHECVLVHTHSNTQRTSCLVSLGAGEQFDADWGGWGLMVWIPGAGSEDPTEAQPEKHRVTDSVFFFFYWMHLTPPSTVTKWVVTSLLVSWWIIEQLYWVQVPGPEPELGPQNKVNHHKKRHKTTTKWLETTGKTTRNWRQHKTTTCFYLRLDCFSFFSSVEEVGVTVWCSVCAVEH